MKELYLLAQLLSDVGAEYTFLPMYDGYQICLYKNGELIDDAVWHSGSHGYSEGLLETFKLSDCVGYETATEIFDGWERMMAD